MRVLALIAASLFALPANAAAPPDPAVLRARAALALVFTGPPKPMTYTEAYTQAAEQRKPLVVFVAQPAAEVAGCVCVAVEAFPDAGRAVVLGLPHANGFHRVDLPGRPDAVAIRAALASPSEAAWGIEPAILPPLFRCDGTTGCTKP